MDFTFTSTRPPPTTTGKPPEAPDQQHVRGKNDENIPKVSFRDKVLGTQTVSLREKVDLIANKMAQVELVKGNRLMPVLHVDQTIMKDLSLPWKDALIVKLLGKNLGYNTMKTKLENVWKLFGGIELMDVGNAFYMVKFDAEEDKNKVINGGPWMIYDHYLAVRQWTPTFNASTAKIDKTMVWIRIPSLNLVFYDESVLWALASMVGNPVKVDLHTLKVARGRFARMCVEVDLTQPVVGRVGVNGEWYQVQYEGLHIICTQCGCYGHLLKDCAPQKKQSEVVVVSNEDGDSEPVKQVSEPAKVSIEPTEPKKNNSEPVIKAADTLYNVSITDAAINDDIRLMEENKCTPNFLHGDWIKVERKKRNNKFNNQGINSLFKGRQQLPQHAKFGFPNRESYVKMQKQIQNEEMDSQIGLNQKARNRLKKKRLNEDTNADNKVTTNKPNSGSMNIGSSNRLHVKGNKSDPIIKPTQTHSDRRTNMGIPILQLTHTQARQGGLDDMLLCDDSSNKTPPLELDVHNSPGDGQISMSA
jgi:hypothetical protein